MNARRSIGVLVTICLAVVLTACGNDREPSASTPTSTAETTTGVTATVTQAVIAPTQVAQVASIGATPVMAATPVVGASPLAGTVVVIGQEHVDFYVSSDGCYGLGSWRGLQPGAQVVVRDASGTVIDVTQLAASADDGCSWTFETSAPVDGFVSVSVPMVMEHWLTADDVAGGNVVVELP